MYKGIVTLKLELKCVVIYSQIKTNQTHGHIFRVLIENQSHFQYSRLDTSTDSL